MTKQPVIAIFDIGKTNKKLFLFNELYKIVYEECRQFTQVTDEDSFECEDIGLLTEWVKRSIARLSADQQFEVKAVNFSAYGASFVLINEAMEVALPLYNYLKPFPVQLQDNFYHQYGGREAVTKQTASPALGNLNSGLQLYRLKYQKPDVFAKIKYAVHLPQFASFLISGKLYSDMTSIGCHSALWDFENNHYHRWVTEEGIEQLLPQVKAANHVDRSTEHNIPVGIGLHDSSAALIPYLELYADSFVLISTGTWAISINPFNHDPLTSDELAQDTLCYLSASGEPVKASRLFAGNEHEEQARRLAAYFDKPFGYFKTVRFNEKFIGSAVSSGDETITEGNAMISSSAFVERELMSFNSYEEAYQQLMYDIVQQQIASTNLVLLPETSTIFVDGGFSHNDVYMNLLARAYPGIKVYAATVPQASALGAALAIHAEWNRQELPADIIQLKLYPAC